MESLIKDYEKFATRHKASEAAMFKALDALMKQVSDVKAKIGNDPTIMTPSLSDLATSVKGTAAAQSEDQKELYNALGKYGKAIDKRFKPDLGVAANPEAFLGKEDILKKTVALHFIRHGNFELGANFVEEAHLSIPNEIKTQFVEMYQILEAIRSKNLEPAIRWARSKAEELDRKGSSLDFDLHKLQFIRFLTEGERQRALEYAKSTFGHFAHRHLSEIQRLMCSFIYINKLANSPYADFMSTSSWSDVQHKFTRDFCSLLGLSCESPLYVSVTVGSSAIPTIIKMSTIMTAKKAEWSAQNELPVEIPLPDDVRFHSIFACPVSKEQGTEENPPMMMPCGHVICKESLTRLSKGNSSRFKCPYCPSESTSSQAQRISF